MIQQRDSIRLADALGACDFLVSHLDDHGGYHHPEQWGPEGNLYVARIASVLLEAWAVSREDRYLAGARCVLDALARTQRPDGHWALGLYGKGIEYDATKKVKERDHDDDAFPWVAGSAAVVLDKYRRTTGDDGYREVTRTCLDALATCLSTGSGLIDADLQDWNLCMTRAESLIGLSCWTDQRPELAPCVERLADWLEGQFATFDAESQPFCTVLSSLALLRVRGFARAGRLVKEVIDRYLATRSYACEEIPGGWGHRDTSRGIITTEGNIRGTGALAILMKSYDLAAGREEYTVTGEYLRMSTWIDGMKDADGGYFEFQKASDMKRRAKGSPGQTIPCIWIFGSL